MTEKLVFKRLIQFCTFRLKTLKRPTSVCWLSVSSAEPRQLSKKPKNDSLQMEEVGTQIQSSMLALMLIDISVTKTAEQFVNGSTHHPGKNKHSDFDHCSDKKGQKATFQLVHCTKEQLSVGQIFMKESTVAQFFPPQHIQLKANLNQ